MTCHLKTVRIGVVMMEKDFWTADDCLCQDVAIVENTHNTTFQRFTYALTTKDDRDYSGHFELYALLYHNCTTDGTYKIIKQDLGDFSVYTKWSTGGARLNITNNGDYSAKDDYDANKCGACENVGVSNPHPKECDLCWNDPEFD
ncbi:hypothetical protein CAEBREN_19343 [Caenorhabditis brenneri]|uniref:Uncharacterized protein n=1 Tax=Caenorhabditis brenneri TaxID=135651 RepID=G0MQV8_CAEBE|nr:hypothetical protein CAEBREN_19343 [Caenorhabditis brenneri]